VNVGKDATRLIGHAARDAGALSESQPRKAKADQEAGNEP